MIEVKAKLNNVRISAKKMRLVADAIRGVSVATADDRLAVLFKKSSPVVAKLLKSAIANAKDRYEVNESDLVVKSIIVGKGVAMKRWRPAAFGSAHPFRKHSCHVELVLSTKAGVKVTAKDKKSTPIETVDLTKTDQKPVTEQATDKKNKFIKKVRSTGAKLAKGKDNMNVKKG